MSANYTFVQPAATDQGTAPNHALLHCQEEDCIVDLNNRLTVLEALTPTSGAGSPEGAVTGSPGRRYWDTTNKNDWVKDSGTGNTGWVQLTQN